MSITGDATAQMVKLEFSFTPGNIQNGNAKDVAFFYFKTGAGKSAIKQFHITVNRNPLTDNIKLRTLDIYLHGWLS